MNILGLAALAVCGLFSISILLYLFVGLIAVLAWKVYRSIHLGCSFWD
ncbi:MAG: hypothetical protein HFH30_03230 [Eubacterium sp.]|nr:hypothetical protein [Eubacterium sp.]MCI8917235.1 hypothetical protein [Eubacterium sp.]